MLDPTSFEAKPDCSRNIAALSMLSDTGVAAKGQHFFLRHILRSTIPTTSSPPKYLLLNFPRNLGLHMSTQRGFKSFNAVCAKQLTRPGRHPRVRHRRGARADPSFSRGCAGGTADGGSDVLPMGDLGREGRHRNKGRKKGDGRLT